MPLHTCTKILHPGKGYSCVFRQPRADSHCRLAHGYDLIFTTTLEATELDRNGWVYDFGNFKRLDEVIKKNFDHRWIVAADDPTIGLIEQMHRAEVCNMNVLPKVGCEAFAVWLAVEATNMIQDSGDLDRVRVRSATVSEHNGNHATYIP